MKILFLTPWYPDEKKPNHGVFIREQACAVAQHHQVVVIAAKVDYQRFGFCSYAIEESVFQKVKEYRLTIKRSFPLYNQLNYFLVSRKVALSVIKNFQPDLIHGNIGYPGGFWSWLVSRKINKPYVLTEHTFIYNNFRSFLHKKLTVFAMNRASALITVSKKSAQEISKYCQTRVTVIPNMVDISRFAIVPFPDSAVPIIGFMGGLSSKVKGLDVLLRVMSKMKKDFILHIGGDGSQLTEFKASAAELGILHRCVFHGYVNYEAVPSFMNQLHFFVNSSRWESFGIAIIEAMASGLPVVCFKNGGPNDFVDSTNGILVENQNEEKLREAIEWMMASYATFDRQKIRAIVSDRFSEKAFFENIHKVYTQTVKKNPSATDPTIG